MFHEKDIKKKKKNTGIQVWTCSWLNKCDFHFWEKYSLKTQKQKKKKKLAMRPIIA